MAEFSSREWRTGRRGNLVEAITDDHDNHFLATAFHRAQGQHLDFEKWTPEFIQHYGETIGQLLGYFGVLLMDFFQNLAICFEHMVTKHKPKLILEDF